jgi:hypothetical protein
MSFGIYMVGYIVMMLGILMGAYFLQVPPRWIGVTAVVLVGLGILMGVTTTRHRDPAE